MPGCTAVRLDAPDHALFVGGTLRYWLCSGEGVAEASGLDAPRGDGTWLWVHAESPTPEELRATADALGLRSAAVYEGVQPHARTLRQIHGDQILLALRTVWYVREDSDVETSRVVLIVGENVLLTVLYGGTDPVTPAVRRLADHDEVREHGPTGGATSVVYEVVAGYARAAEAVADDIGAIENEVFSARRATVLQRIYTLMREVLEFRDAVDPMEPIVSDLSARRADSHLLQDARHLAKEAQQSVAASEQFLTLILDVHTGQISLWQNQDMRQISAWAALVATPTVITGIYGMDFVLMPERELVWGYPAVLVVILVLCVVLFRNFRRKGWL